MQELRNHASNVYTINQLDGYLFIGGHSYLYGYLTLTIM